MQQGSIVVLPIPFTDLSSKKQRPCLILSNKNLETNQDVIVLALTSQSSARADDNVLEITNTDLATGTLPKTSYARCHKVFCLQKDLIRKSIGQLTPTMFQKIHDKFMDLVQVEKS